MQKYKLVCEKCGKEYGAEKIYTCSCSGRLEVSINIDAIEVSKEEIMGRRGNVLAKYFEFLPLLATSPKTLGEGYTPLMKSERLCEKLGLKNLYLKNETVNPTGSFKDRPIVVGANKAVEFGAEVLVSASSGNAATSLAAWCARFGLKCVTFVPVDAPKSKLAQLQMLGALVYRVVLHEKGKDPTAEMLAFCVRKFGWHPVPSFGSFNPYQIEGAKTVAYEIAEEIDADAVVVPVGGAGLLLGTLKGFKEYRELGWIEKEPIVHAVQSEGCAPLVRAWKERSEIRAWANPRTVAGGIADPYTWDGNAALKLMYRNGGTAVAVPDSLILEAQESLAKYAGIFAEPTGSASLAGIIALRDAGVIQSSDKVVCLVTGTGFKDLDIVVTRMPEVPVIEVGRGWI
ncbi:MAG: threonine synthase [Thermoplasmata archaeon]|nr:threonine synthase [Thermoplasmata archaeon]